MSTGKKVAIAMSGGVDSSVAAMLLKKQGYDVVGFTMKLWYDETCQVDGRENACCDEKSVADARKVADTLGIPFYLVDARKVFKKEVVDYFIEEFKAMRTPNPCVKCNEKIKFGWLLDFAQKAGCEYLATGHYARITSESKVESPKSKGCGAYHLLKAVDEKKDQSYFLYNLNQNQLTRVIFPLGDLTKDEVRKMAKEANLPVHEKVESQEICFVQENDYRKFLERHIPKEYFKEGQIVDSKGYVVGKHKGLVNYTIGQRKGVDQAISISGKEKAPAYVVGYDVKRNRLIVGDDSEVYANEMTIKSNTLDTKNLERKDLSVKIRYKSKAVECKVSKLPNKKYLVQFNEPQRAITPGQSAVFYDGDEVTGGGIIE